MMKLILQRVRTEFSKGSSPRQALGIARSMADSSPNTSADERCAEMASRKGDADPRLSGAAGTANFVSDTPVAKITNAKRRRDTKVFDLPDI